MKITVQLPVIGMDIAKNVFQIHAVDPETGEIERLKLKRAKVVEFFANRQPSLVALEACGGAHHWARTLSTQGHQVKLLPARHVKAFVLRDKTDARDAQAIWVAAQQPHIREVPVKSEQQHACLALHRMRAQLMKMRIMQTNALRGLLCEFGIVLPEGHRTCCSASPVNWPRPRTSCPACSSRACRSNSAALSGCSKTSITSTGAWPRWANKTSTCWPCRRCRALAL